MADVKERLKLVPVLRDGTKVPYDPPLLLVFLKTVLPLSTSKAHKTEPGIADQVQTNEADSSKSAQ